PPPARRPPSLFFGRFSLKPAALRGLSRPRTPCRPTPWAKGRLDPGGCRSAAPHHEAVHDELRVINSHKELSVNGTLRKRLHCASGRSDDASGGTYQPVRRAGDWPRRHGLQEGILGPALAHLPHQEESQGALHAP